MLARDNIIVFDNKKLPKFPDRFDNEIYISNGKTNENVNPVEYISNFSLKYVVEGKEDYIVEGERKGILDNKMLIINDKCNASFIGSNAKAISIFINPEVFIECQKSMLDKQGFLENPFDVFGYPMSFFDDVQELEHEGLKRMLYRIVNNPKLIVTQDYYYELANQIVFSQNILQKKINQIGSVKFTTRKEIFKRLELAKTYLDDNLDQSFDLDTVSQISCISKFHFIRVFKEVYGVTPHRYHLSKKFARIKTLLTERKGEIVLQDMAYNFGFSNYSVFYKQFKLLNGSSPSDYIKFQT